MSGRRSVADARDTRHAILRHAADVASVGGLEGLTVGGLAADLKMSKSGVIGQFGSKEALQLATLELAVEIFRERVWVPVQHLTPGLPRLLAVCEAWTDYVRNPDFPGGCFIAQVTYEYDGRSGRVHDALAQALRRWRSVLIRDVQQAIDDGDLAAGLDPEQIAFSIEALAAGANPARRLQGDADPAGWSLQAMHAVLGIPVVAA